MTYQNERLKFGIFAQPFHRPGEHPTVAYERDMEVIELLDRLNYDEAWIGEHHSAGWETVGDPALFIAAAAQRTRHIRLGTGVVSLPYHHPFTVAHRMVQLDHLTRGRVNFGVGPGALYSDAYQLGIEPTTQRRRMGEALAAIVRLLRGEVVTEQTEWYELRDARLQIASYQQPHVPVFVAHAFSPAGAKAAGRHGLGMLSVASSELGGLETMSQAWQWAVEEAEAHGAEVHRDNWRVTMTLHLADSKEEAIDDIREGVLALNHEYFGTLGIRFEDGRDTAEWLAERPGVAIGTPDDAIAAIEQVLEASGGVGGILINHREWARTTEKMRRSYELFARHVMPRFQGQSQPLEANLEWAREGHRTLFRSVRAARARRSWTRALRCPTCYAGDRARRTGGHSCRWATRAQLPPFEVEGKRSSRHLARRRGPFAATLGRAACSACCPLTAIVSVSVLGHKRACSGQAQENGIVTGTRLPGSSSARDRSRSNARVTELPATSSSRGSTTSA